MENNITQTEQPQMNVNYAGFWWRFLAYIIDAVLLSFVSWIIIMPFLGIFGITMIASSESGQGFEDPMIFGPLIVGYFSSIGLNIIVQWLYYALMESSKHQGTVGKIALKIKVTDYNGDRIDFARATGRYFGKIISGIILLIGYIMAGFTEKKQALHDMLAGCLVIKE